MRHKVAGKKLGRSTGQRKGLRRNLINDLFRYERIRTTLAKAHSIRGDAERLITRAKKGNQLGEAQAVHTRRWAAARLNDPEIVKKLFTDIAPRYVDRPGGYTRIIKLGPRVGDAAEIVLLELVE